MASYQPSMPGNKSAILVLISLLVVALIFSSTSRFYVFGKSVPPAPNNLRNCKRDILLLLSPF
jgi:hypothetical protein